MRNFHLRQVNCFPSNLRFDDIILGARNERKTPIFYVKSWIYISWIYRSFSRIRRFILRCIEIARSRRRSRGFPIPDWESSSREMFIRSEKFASREMFLTLGERAWLYLTDPECTFESTLSQTRTIAPASANIRRRKHLTGFREQGAVASIEIIAAQRDRGRREEGAKRAGASRKGVHKFDLPATGLSLSRAREHTCIYIPIPTWNC